MNLTISKEEAIDIACQDSELFDCIEHNTIGKCGRWEISMESIVEEVSTGKFYRLDWKASTNDSYGIVDQFTDTEYELVELERKEVVTTKWVEVK